MELNRRQVLQGMLGTAASLWLSGPLEAAALTPCCTGDAPLDCIRREKADVIAAVAESQLEVLFQGVPAESAWAVTEDVLDFMSYLELPLQQGLCLGLTGINLYALRHTGRRFSKLDPDTRRRLLNQGEYPGPHAGQVGMLARLPLVTPKPLPLVTWDDKYLLHTAVSAVSMLTRLVIFSRPAARHYVGLHWSPACRRPENLVRMPVPPQPRLDVEYDVCVIGSGAGGAVVASRAAEQGKRVLIVDEGAWISPHELVVQHADGTVHPPRDDVALARLYFGAGVQIPGLAADTFQQKSKLQFLKQLAQVEKRQTISTIRAKVVGGGPYINNAIHLEMDEAAWRRWGDGRPAGISFANFQARMRAIVRELGVNTTATLNGAGSRSWKFVEACQKANVEVRPLPVSMEPHNDCVGCGADNVMDPFGSHTGGLHPYRDAGPNSYLMRALHAAVAAQVLPETRARALQLEHNEGGRIAAAHLLVEDRCQLRPAQSGMWHQVRARNYVLAAGAAASSKILIDTLSGHGLWSPQLGHQLTANVVTPVYAVYDQPLVSPGSRRPEPGIAQCFFVEKTTAPDGSLLEPALENWFHYPGTLAIALTGWFEQHIQVMQRYDHLSLCGMVVPTSPRPENHVDADGMMHLEIDANEFELLLIGLEKIARIYLGSATYDNGVSIYFPTKALILDDAGHPLAIRCEATLQRALSEIRQRGPEFLNMATAHPQGGNPLGHVVDPQTFRVRLGDGRLLENVYVADASLIPAGCGVNPQLTVKALAMYAADALLGGRLV